MEEFLPGNVISNVTCYVIDDTPDEKSVDITTCMNFGQVAEFHKKSIVAQCDIDLHAPTSIDIFQAYEPSVKYYIIIENSKMLIVKNGKELTKFKTLDNVEKYEIGDFLEKGFPQVRIFFTDELEPTLTDFFKYWNSENNGGERFPQRKSELELNLNTKLQRMKLRLKEITEVNKEKKRCRIKSLFHLSSNLSLENEDSLKSTKEGLILCIERIFHKLYQRSWVICYVVKNNSLSAVISLKLILSSGGERMKYRTCTLCYSNSTGNFNLVTQIEPASTVFVTVILEEPVYLHNLSPLGAVLLYKITTDGPIQQLHLPLCSLAIKDVINGTLAPFLTDEITLDDLITVIVLSDKVLLEITLIDQSMERILDEILQTNLSMQRVPFNECCYVCVPKYGKGLSGLVVLIEELSDNIYLVDCYTSNSNHMTLFVNSLKDLLPSGCTLTEKSKSRYTVVEAVNSLGDELNFLHSAFTSGISKPSLPLENVINIIYSESNWKMLCRRKEKCELLTDSSFENVT